MHRDSLLTSHRLRLRAAREAAVELNALRAKLRQDVDARKREIAELGVRLDVLAKVGELFRALMDRMVTEHVRLIEGVVSEGLRSIFFDQDLSFEAELSQRYNKVAIDFYLRQEAERMTIRAHPLDAFGGGPSSIASLILKVLAMRRMKKWPLLVMDETLAAVSDEYLDRTGAFLQELARKTGMCILLVTHKQAFFDHADIGYRATSASDGDGVRSLLLEREGARAH